MINPCKVDKIFTRTTALVVEATPLVDTVGFVLIHCRR